MENLHIILKRIIFAEIHDTRESLIFKLMYRRLIFSLILLPIALLVCLSCPMKHQLKLLLDFPVQSSQPTDNYKSSRTCSLSYPVKKDRHSPKSTKSHQKSFLRTDSYQKVLAYCDSRYLFHFPNYAKRENISIFLFLHHLVI